MTSYGWSWLGALAVAAFGFYILNRIIPAQARNKNLARFGAVLESSGIGLITPATHEHNRPALEITAAVLIVGGLAFHICFSRKRKVQEVSD